MKDLVLLTYSFKDMHRVRRLRDALWQHDVRVWPGGKSLMPGTQAWMAEVNDRLAEAVCVVAVLSKDAALSNWVKLIISLAREHHVPVLPVIIGGEPGHIMLVELEGEDWFDLRWSKNYRSEVRAMVAMIRHLAASLVVTGGVKS